MSERRDSMKHKAVRNNQIKDSKAVQYRLVDKQGNTKYIGMTNNPAARQIEHLQSGKMKAGDRMEIQSRAVDRNKAERLESGRLHGHRQSNQGKNPSGNKTRDGKYTPRSGGGRSGGGRSSGGRSGGGRAGEGFRGR